MNMQYCPVCGTRLQLKAHPTEPPTPFCERCGDYRFPLFSTAVAVVLLDRDEKQMLLIRQYGEPDSVLVAGYVDKGETAEDAVRREVWEELGLTASDLRFNRSRYYAPSETLMLGYTAAVPHVPPRPNGEVDAWEWVPVDQALDRVRPGGLAEALLRDFFELQRDN